MDKFKEFLDGFSLTGGITILLFILTISGIIMAGYGNPSGPEIYKMFGSAFLSFVTGRVLERVKNGSN